MYCAIAQARLGHGTSARRYYYQAMEMIEEDPSGMEELNEFIVESEALLGMPPFARAQPTDEGQP